MHTLHADKTKQQGFTLVELSIVLVIIGLIIGGVLVGQDMIKAAEVRATLQQIEKYNTAVNTFRSKYNAMPGDMTLGKATSFGIFDVTGRAGDGDSILDGVLATPFQGEVALFFDDMSVATLVDGNFSANTWAAPAAAISTGLERYLPVAKIGGHFIPFSNGGQNFYLLAGVTSIATTGAITHTANIRPIDGTNLDNKVDDGLPGTGTIQSRDGGTTLDTAASVGAGGAAAAVCNDSGVTPTAYNTRNESPLCTIRFRFN